MNSTLHRAAALSLALAAAPFVEAATLNSGDQLTISAGSATTNASGTVTAVTGSWFSMDTNGDSKIQPSEKVVLRQGTKGLIIGTTQPAGSFHGGAPASGDTNQIDAPWGFAGNTGVHWTSSAVTGGTGGLNFSGWTVAWNTTAAIPMGAGAWTPLNCSGAGVSCATYANGVAQLTWDGAYGIGHPYVLDYSGTVPPGDPSGFGGTKYHVHLEGLVQPASAVTASVTPANGTTVPANTSSIVVTFSQAMNPSSVTSSFMTIPGVTVQSPTASSGNTVFTFPISALSAGSSYTISFHPGPTSSTGTAVTLPPDDTFQTISADTTPPTVVTTSPASGATISPNTSTLIITFSEPMDPASVTAAAVSISGGVSVGTPTASSNNTVFTFPIGGLSTSTNYTITFNAGPKDAAGNALTLPAPRTFTTRSASNPVLSAATNDRLLVCSGSKFGMEISPGKVLYTSLSQANPLAIGMIQGPTGANHSGAPTGTENTVIDLAWSFFGNTGYHFTTSPITDNGNGTLDFSGWRVGWNTVNSINMGSGAPAVFTWDGIYGHTYALAYTTTVPNGDPSGFGGVNYSLVLNGVVNGGPSNVNAPCGGGSITPSGVAISVGGVSGAAVALNAQLSPDDTALAAAGFSSTGRPSGYDFYKYGIIYYTVSGLAPTGTDAPTVTLTFPQPLPAGAKVFKVSPAGYQDITSRVSIAGNTVTLVVPDNGDLDEYKTAGTIVDPIAVGIPLNTNTSGGAGSGGGGGGCAFNPNAKFDASLLLSLVAGLGFSAIRRRSRSDSKGTRSRRD